MQRYGRNGLEVLGNDVSSADVSVKEWQAGMGYVCNGLAELGSAGMVQGDKLDP